MNQSAIRALLSDLNGLAEGWERQEDNSPYGLDEHGTRIPALNGTQCAKMIKELVIRIALGRYQ
jgi:hypothetical protein